MVLGPHFFWRDGHVQLHEEWQPSLFRRIRVERLRTLIKTINVYRLNRFAIDEEIHTALAPDQSVVVKAAEPKFA